MNLGFKYSWQNGRLVKVDHLGNLFSDPAQFSEPIRKESSPNSPGLNMDTNLSMPATMRALTCRIPDASEALSPTVGASIEETQSPENVPLTEKDLAKRDREAVAYTKDLLIEGDTLVYISHPSGSKCFDSTGFELSDAPHRLHSGRLLATGSKRFAELLGPGSQYRMIRKKKLRGSLPPGIDFVLDLTPPDEGDVAVELTSELSCSPGVRLWYRSAHLCNVPDDLVRGEDEVPEARRISSWRSATTTRSAGQNSADLDAPKIVLEPAATAVDEIGESAGWVGENRQIETAVKLSLEELVESRGEKPGAIKLRNVPEYCPVRHRAGITRLLKVIEDRNPRLNSAPKVWTLFALAKHFDCTSAVVDWIVAWIMEDLNTQFIEILPEVSLRMAFGLKNYMLCRASFSVLVSEEALSLASREVGHNDADRHGTNQFGRIREDIDEDLRTRIEYASKNFYSRISATFGALSQEMSWITQLPEFQKLKRFKADVSSGVGNELQAVKWLSAVDQLICDIRATVYSCIMSSLEVDLDMTKSAIATRHRRAERCTSRVDLEKWVQPFFMLYNSLVDKERIFTRFFWSSLRYTELPVWIHNKPSASMLFDSRGRLNSSILEAINAGLFNNGIVPPEAIIPAPDSFLPNGSWHTDRDNNVQAQHVVNPGDHHSGSWGGSRSDETVGNYRDNEIHWGESTDVRYEPFSPEKVAASKDSLSDGGVSDLMDYDEYLAKHHLLDPTISPHSTLDNGTAGHANKNSFFVLLKDRLVLRPKQPPPRTKVPNDNDILANSPFFSVRQCLLEASAHIREVATAMLDTREMKIDIRLTDTLLCLGPEEFKYLPLWAGGDDDESGGVFDDIIPVATLGPNGPGPSFHTGFSSASAASSEFDTMSERTSFNPSVAVEDGYSDHIDRRVVVADDDFHSETFSEDSEIYDRKGKGVDRRGFHAGSPNSEAAFSLADTTTLSAFSIIETTPSNSALGANVDMEIEYESEDSDADTTVGQVDNEDIEEAWDGGESESFDFGDGDEKMIKI